MKVLIACEESQEVCKAFRRRGHEAYSCDIQEPSGGHPEWHILGDAVTALRGGGQIVTMNDKGHYIDAWDLLIAHPPCTYLSNAGARHLWKGHVLQADRVMKGIEGRDLFMEKFYSDLENNVYETNEQRANAFDVALHRRDTMREEMEKLYNRCVLPAPISDVMKIPYRAEIVWLVIRHALSWHDNPDGVAGCVSYYAPLNRSDQPQPKIELKLKGKGENHG